MRRRVLSITIESFKGPIYADSPLPFGDHSRRLVAELTKAPHHYQPVEPPESLDAENIEASVKAALRGSTDDVIILHVLSHGKPVRQDDVRVVGADGKTPAELSVRFWLDQAYDDDLPTETHPDLAEKYPSGPWV